MPARCRMMNGLREMALVFDLSTHGCGLVLRSLNPVVGSRLLIKTPGLEALSGIVRWVNEHRCGVEFDSPLYQPVVDHLCRQYLRKPRENNGTRTVTRGLSERL